MHFFSIGFFRLGMNMQIQDRFLFCFVKLIYIIVCYYSIIQYT